MKTYIFGGAALLVLAAAIIWGSTGQVQDAGTIKLGAIISETGAAASFGEMSHKGIELAVKEINAAGGIDGREVEVLFEDDGTDPTKALSAYQKLVAIDKVDAIIGSNFDFVTQPLFAAAEKGDVAVVTPSSPYYAGYFEENPNSFFMMTDLARMVHKFDSYLETQEYQKVGILRYPSIFGEVFGRELNAGVEETYTEIGNNNFRTQILKLKSAGVDLVFIDMVANDPEQFLKQSREQGYAPKVITHAGVKDALANAADKKLFDGVVVLDWNISTDSFVQKFKTTYGIEPNNSANRAYDAVFVLAQAISEVNDRTEVSAYLAENSFETPNGTVRFGQNHEAANTEIKLFRVESGNLVEVH